MVQRYGAVLEIADHRKNLNEAHLSIKHNPTPIGLPFYMVDADGNVIAESEHPGPLSTYGFANGAQEVRHDYDATQVQL